MVPGPARCFFQNESKRVAGFAITGLRLAEFRSHAATDVAFDRRPVVIVGPNGAGKTNVLEAVSLLSPGRGLRRADMSGIARRSGNAGSADGNLWPAGRHWKVRAEVRGIGTLHEVETWAAGSDPRQVRLDGKAVPQGALGRTLRILWLVPAMDRLWIEAAEGRRRFLDRVTLSFAPDHAEASLAYERAMRERNRLLKDQATDLHWYAALEAQMALSARLVIANRAAALVRLAEALAGDSAFPRADLAILDAEDVGDGSDLAGVWAAGRRRDMAAGRTLVGPHRADLVAVYASKGVPADQCSTGEQKALLISLILGNARALADDLGAAPVLLLDEVAAHLDAARRAALYDEICAMGAQAMMTGTEGSLFDGLGARAQVFAVTDDGTGSRMIEVAQ